MSGPSSGGLVSGPTAGAISNNPAPYIPEDGLAIFQINELRGELANTATTAAPVQGQVADVQAFID